MIQSLLTNGWQWLTDTHTHTGGGGGGGGGGGHHHHHHHHHSQYRWFGCAGMCHGLTHQVAGSIPGAINDFLRHNCKEIKKKISKLREKKLSKMRELVLWMSNDGEIQDCETSIFFSYYHHK